MKIRNTIISINKYITHNKHKNLLIQLIFLSLTLIISSFYLRLNILSITGQNALPTDGLYHIQEAKEILTDVYNNILPSFNHFFGIQGLAIATYYPWISFTPIIIGLLLHISMKFVIKTSMILVIYMTFNILFYVANKYWHNITWALLFTFLMSTTPILTDFPYSNDFALTVGSPLIVISLFGWLSLIKYNHWKMLAIGVTLLIYTHLVSAFMTIITLLILFICNITKFNKTKFFAVIKAGIMTILSTTIIWLPMIILRCYNHIYTPLHYFVANNKQNDFMSSISLFYFVLLLVLFKYHKKLTKLEKIYTILSIFFALIAFEIIPTYIIQYTVFSATQYAYRWGIISFDLIAIISTPYVWRFLTSYKSHHNSSLSILKQTFIFTLLAQPMISLLLTIKPQNNTIIHKYTATHALERMLKFKSPHINNRLCSNIIKIRANQRLFDKFSRLNTNKAYKNQYYLDEFMPTSTQEYYGRQYPQTMGHDVLLQSYMPNLIMQYNMHRNHMYNINNGISTNYKKIHNNVLLPIILYHGQSYQFYINGKRFTPYKYKHHEPVIHYLPKGYNEITFNTPIMWYRYLSIIISVLTILITIGYNFRKQLK